MEYGFFERQPLPIKKAYKNNNTGAQEVASQFIVVDNDYLSWIQVSTLFFQFVLTW